MGIDPMVWRNYDPATGMGDPSTPLSATLLNQWTSDIVAVSEAAEGFAAEAADSAASAGALTDDVVATLLTNPASATRGELDVRYPPVSALQDVLGRIRTGAQDVSVLFVTDSTGTFDQATWTSPLPAFFASMFPTHTVKRQAWNYTSGTGWAAEATASTGSGPRTIKLWLAGAPGENWPYFLVTARRHQIFQATNPDIIFISLGHNDGAAVRRSIDRAIMSIERMRLMAPQAQIVLVSQNPTTAAGKDSGARADAYRRIAVERGYGFIDVTQAFADYPGPATDLVPAGDVHPSAAGYALWSARFAQEWGGSAQSRPIPMGLPALTTAAKSLIPRVAVPLASNGWTLSNATAATETTIVPPGRTNSQRLIKTVGGSVSYASRALPATVLGTTITIVAWVYVASTGGYSGACQLQTRDSSGVRLSADVPAGIRDEWTPLMLTDTVTPATTGMQLWLLVDPQAGNQQPTVYIGDVDVFLGGYPHDPVYTS